MALKDLEDSINKMGILLFMETPTEASSALFYSGLQIGLQNPDFAYRVLTSKSPEFPNGAHKKIYEEEIPMLEELLNRKGY